MKNPYLIKLSSGAVIRNRGGLRSSLRKYAFESKTKEFTFFQQIMCFFVAVWAAILNKAQTQIWKIRVEVTYARRNYTVTIDGQGRKGFVADCFVKIISDDSFIVLYENYNEVVKKGEISYKLFQLSNNGPSCISEKTILTDATRHYSYPSIISADDKSFTFTVESSDVDSLEIYRFDYEGNQIGLRRLSGQYIDPNIIALPDSELSLLLYSEKRKPDELKFRLIKVANESLEFIGGEHSHLNYLVARGGGDNTVRKLSSSCYQIKRYSQVSLPTYGSHIVESSLSLDFNDGSLSVSVDSISFTLDKHLKKKFEGIRGIHTFSCDSTIDFSVQAFDWR